MVFCGGKNKQKSLYSNNFLPIGRDNVAPKYILNNIY